MTQRAQILEALSVIIGLKWSLTRRVLTMRAFHFGQIYDEGLRSWGEWILAVQCPWRLDDSSGIVTGRADLWKSADPTIRSLPDDWDYNAQPNLQDHLIAGTLAATPSPSGEARNATSGLVVEAVDADRHGEVRLDLSRGYALRIFPDGSQGDQWRVFSPDSALPNFVVSGGRIERG